MQSESLKHSNIRCMLLARYVMKRNIGNGILGWVKKLLMYIYNASPSVTFKENRAELNSKRKKLLQEVGTAPSTP